MLQHQWDNLSHNLIAYFCLLLIRIVHIYSQNLYHRWHTCLSHNWTDISSLISCIIFCCPEQQCKYFFHITFKFISKSYLLYQCHQTKNCVFSLFWVVSLLCNLHIQLQNLQNLIKLKIDSISYMMQIYLFCEFRQS